MNMQICSACGVSKPIEKFEWSKNRPNPRKKCTQCRTKDHVFTERELKRIREYKKAYRDSGKAKDVWERHKYGVAKSDLDYSHCLICGGTDRLSLDHCHSSNKFRGLLCSKCNTGIGMFGEDVEKMANAIKYINHHRFHDLPHYEL